MFQKHLPFPIQRYPFFYGWLILVGSVLGQIMSTPGQTIGVSVFTDHLIEHMGLSRLWLSAAYMVGTAAGSLLLPFAGRYYDVIGGRRAVVFAAIGLGMALLYLSQVDRLARLIGGGLSPLLVSAVSFAVMLIGFLFVRFAGQGTLTLMSRNVLMEWFETRRGLANGISGVFVALGFSMGPVVFHALIQAAGWRGAYLWLALVTGVLFPVIAYFLLRDKPEDYGLKPDGDLPPPNVADAAALSHPERDYTLGEARRTFEFWAFGIGLSIFALFMTAVTFHIFSVFAGAGLDETTAVSIFLPAALISVVFNLVGGWLSDRTRLKYFYLIHFAAQILAALGLLFLNRPGAIYAVILGNGIATGSFWLLAAVAWPRLFGRTHLGAISGAGMFWNIFFSAFGPVLFALSEEFGGSYDFAIVGCLIVMCGFFVAGFRLEH